MAVKHKVERPVNNNSIDCLSVILRHLEKFINEPHSMPQGQDLIKVCETIVHGLGRLIVPHEPSEIGPFISGVRTIQDFLYNVCRNEEYREQLEFATLKALYQDISDPDVRPGPAMSVVLQLVEPNYIPNAVNLIITGHSDASLEQALFTLCDWMQKWTNTPRLSECVLEFIRGLENQKRFEILINVTLEVIERFFRILMLPVYRVGIAPIVMKMLSCMQDSPEAFHKIIPHVPSIIYRLKQENSDSSLSCAQDIVNITTALIEHFPGYLTLYQPLQKVFLLYPPTPNYKIYINCLPWSNKIQYSIIQKSDAGKVGLNNLGNTCYMNSVLQALFMTKLFSNNILLREYKWPLLTKLQTLFALLQYSQRVSLSPSDILHLARPPGFQRGHQHDSSEFLGHLLDVLHEQEKSFLTCRKTDGKPVAPESDPCQSEIASFASSIDSTVVQHAFGGRAETIYSCEACGTNSIRADNFRDLQLSFPCDFTDGQSVQSLLEYYLKPEKLCGDNQYHCEKCNGLSDAVRIFKVRQPPARLVLTLKHFRYDSSSQQRIKLLHHVDYNPVIKLDGISYELYAAVVHSGSSVDSGHYYTYAKDRDSWYKFNDSSVFKSSASELYNLNPPETPYILFYSRIDCEEPEPISRTELPPFIEAVIVRDNAELEAERRRQTLMEPIVRTFPKDDDPPPGCGGGGPIITNDRFIC